MISLDKNTFSEAINSETPVIVDFWAAWCNPCKALMPVLEAIEAERGNKGEIQKVNIDDSPDLAAKYSVSLVPTLVVFKNGEEVDRMVGGNTKENIIALLDNHK